MSEKEDDELIFFLTTVSSYSNRISFSLDLDFLTDKWISHSNRKDDFLIDECLRLKPSLCWLLICHDGAFSRPNLGLRLPDRWHSVANMRNRWLKAHWIFIHFISCCLMTSCIKLYPCSTDFASSTDDLKEHIMNMIISFVFVISRTVTYT